MKTDEKFIEKLWAFIGEAAPVFYKPDGTVDREKTLALPCYENFKEK